MNKDTWPSFYFVFAEVLPDLHVYIYATLLDSACLTNLPRDIAYFQSP